jgi:hypothetical protein
VAWVLERTISIERPPLVGEISANFCGYRVPRGQRHRSLRPYSRFSRPEPLLFLSNSFSTVLTRLSGPRSRPTTFQKNLLAPGIEPGPLYLQPGGLTTMPQMRSTPKITNIKSKKCNCRDKKSLRCSLLEKMFRPFKETAKWLKTWKRVSLQKIFHFTTFKPCRYYQKSLINTGKSTPYNVGTASMIAE